jgi:3',5'-cyclic-nucleotide phosphodiesterase
MSKFKIIQITDTHLTPEGKEPANHQKIDPYLKLNSVFSDIKSMSEKPDMIVITGDLIHEGIANDYVRLSKLVSHQIDNLNIQINVILGNHDRTKAFFKGFLQQQPHEKYYYVVHTKELDIYFLDSKFHDYEQGYLGQDQLTWLKDNLSDDPNKESIIFLHHPIDGPMIHHMQYSILQEGKELMDVINGTSVKAVFSGHIHFETTFEENDILMHSADSSAYHINCDNPHNHLIYDATSYDIITIDNGEIGVETRTLFAGQDVINNVVIEDTDFVNPNIFR